MLGNLAAMTCMCSLSSSSQAVPEGKVVVNHSVVRQELHGHCNLQGEVDLPLVGHRLWEGRGGEGRGGEGRGGRGEKRGECGIVSNGIHVAI